MSIGQRGADEVREQVELLEEELQSVVLDLAERNSDDGEREADRTIREALTCLARFREAADVDDDAVKELAHAKSLLERAHGESADEHARQSVADAIIYVDKARLAAIDLLIERDKRGIAPVAAKTFATEFVLSLGTPAIIKEVTIAVPRLLAREPDLIAIPPMPPGDATTLGDVHAPAEAVEGDDRPADTEPPKPKEPVAQRTRGGDEGERRQVEALARDTMEDLSSLSTLRILADTEVWRSTEDFERRLLSSLDALVSLARPVRPGSAELDLGEALFGYATEWSVPDRGRAFAFALAMSCVASDAALVWVTLALRRAESKTLPGYVDALSLGSSPHIADKLANLLSGDVPRTVIVVALEVAYRRRMFNAGTMLPLVAHPDLEVASLAMRCLAHAPTELARAALTAGMSSNAVLLQAVAAATLIEKGVLQGRDVLRHVLDQLLRSPASWSKHDESAVRVALRALAILGEPPDAERAWAAARHLRSYREIGFFGHLGHIPLLFATLDELEGGGADPGSTESYVAQCENVANAIRRICGVDPPTFGPGRYDLGAFKKLYEEKVPSLPLHSRCRFGEAFHRKAVLAEIRARTTRQGDRRLLIDELALHSQGSLRFDIDGWIADQISMLKLVEDAWS